MLPLPAIFARTNSFRGPSPRLPGDQRPAFKEWLHFCIHNADLTWIGNFSVNEDAFAPDRRQLGRVIALGRTLPNGPWLGQVQQFLPGQFHIVPGELTGQWGQSSLQWNGEELHLHLQQSDIQADLRLIPQALPALSHQIPLSDTATIHWLMAPRMLATGTLRLGQKTHELQQVPTYHDHNWGHFAWGDNFSWEWGYALPDQPQNPWSLVSVRMHDRNRNSLFSAGLFLWKGAQHAAVFRDAQVQGHTEGVRLIHQAFQIPPSLGLSVPAAFEVPQKLELHAQNGEDMVDLEFQPQDIARILLPDDHDLTGVTAICEACGPVRVQGRVRGEPVEIRGHAVYEFMRHA